jgi:hypothetical protein
MMVMLVVVVVVIITLMMMMMMMRMMMMIRVLKIPRHQNSSFEFGERALAISP